MGLNVRLYELSCPNQITVYFSTGYTGTYIPYDSYPAGTTDITISGLEFDTTFYVKIEDDVTGLNVIEAIKTNDSKGFECYDHINFYLENDCDARTLTIYDLVAPHGNHSSIIGNVPCSYYIFTGSTKYIENATYVTTGTTDQITNEIYTFTDVPTGYVIYVFLVHADGYVPQAETCDETYCENNCCQYTAIGYGNYDYYDCRGYHQFGHTTDGFGNCIDKSQPYSFDSTLVLTLIGCCDLYGYHSSKDTTCDCNKLPKKQGGFEVRQHHCKPNSNLFCFGTDCVEACTCVGTPIRLYYDGELGIGTRFFNDENFTSPYNYTTNGYLVLNNVCYDVHTNGTVIETSSCIPPCDPISGITFSNVLSSEFTYTFTGNPMGPLDYHYQIYDVTSSTTIDDGYTNNTYPSVNRITGLTPEHHYCVVITVDCSSSNFSTPYSGYTTLPSFTFDADYMMLTYEFTDGSDLDTRSGIVVPNIGQTTQDKFLGWSCSSVFPTSGTPIITWGGDNRGTGFESVLIDMNAFKTAHPTDHTMVVDLRAFWYGTQGYNLVNVAGTLWKGGTPVRSGYLWTNPTKTDQLLVASVGKQITLKPLTNKNKSAGQRLATLTYNVTTGIGSFNINDTTTPQITDLP